MATAAPHTFEAVTAVFECAGQSFIARGKTVLSDGWKEIDRRYRAALKNKPETDDADSDTEKTLPPFTEGQTFENPTAKVMEPGFQNVPDADSILLRRHGIGDALHQGCPR